MKTTVVGAFPKISDDHAGQLLRRTLHRFDKGEIGQPELEAAYVEVTDKVIRELEAAGIDVINDGQIRWDDLLAPFAGWGGVERGPLERFYDNNTYFRQPVITGPLEIDGHALVVPFNRAKALATHQLKAAVCGPLTFATLTAEDRRYQDLEARTLAVAGAIAAEIRGLAAHGATLVDVEDPAVVARPDLVALSRRAYEILAATGVDLALQTYFFPADLVLDELASFPVAQVGLDLRSRPTKALDRLAAFAGKIVVLGAVDARNTRLESLDEVAGIVDRAVQAIGADRVWVAPTTGLEYLPHDVASRKLEVLVGGARLAMGVPA